jgi:hypothetical protein
MSTSRPDRAIFARTAPSPGLLTLCISLLKAGAGRLRDTEPGIQAPPLPGPKLVFGPCRRGLWELVHLTTGQPTEVIHNCGDHALLRRGNRQLGPSDGAVGYELQLCKLPTVWITPVDNSGHHAWWRWDLRRTSRQPAENCPPDVGAEARRQGAPDTGRARKRQEAGGRRSNVAVRARESDAGQREFQV